MGSGQVGAETDAGLGRLVTAAHVLARTLRRSGELRVGLQPLPASEYDVLQFVSAHPDATVSEVAQGLRLQTSNVSTTVRALVDRGLLERSPDPRDQRRTRLRPSAAAKRHRELLEAAWARSVAASLAELPAEDAARIRAVVPVFERLAEIVTAGVAASKPR